MNKQLIEKNRIRDHAINLLPSHTKTYEAKLSITARGYWFTAGGAKGSFGYYPHLKNHAGLPIYPDTQLHGNLKMAARWLAGLGAVCDELVSNIFGAGGGDEFGNISKASKLFIGDLTLAADSAAKWQPSRFEVKPRIQINDASRTVEEHFLVDLELAWLDNLVLEAPIYLTIESDKSDVSQKLIEDTLPLLSGFGAFRSRGYGRATNIDISQWRIINSGKSFECKRTKQYRLALTALVNVRNKPVDPGDAQVLTTSGHISTDQLKGWLALAYKNTYGEWPTPAQMNEINLSLMLPAPAANILAYPTPMTTLRDGDDNIKDQWGTARAAAKDNFFNGKSKPLGADCTVTEDGKVWINLRSRRIRNNINDSFITTPNGLFVQELLPAGTIFTGTLRLGALDERFTAKIVSLLLNETANINGSLFELTLEEISPVSNTEKGGPRLLTVPIRLRPNHISSSNRINIASLRTYNTTLKRPRRTRIVVLPGSIITEEEQSTVAWQGFGQRLKIIPPSNYASTCLHKQSPPVQTSSIALNKEQKKMSKAQAGLLRMLLHPALTQEAIEQSLQHRVDKYEGKDKMLAMRQLLQAILNILKDEEKGGLEVMRPAVNKVIKELALARWQPKRPEQRHKINDGGV